MVTGIVEFALWPRCRAVRVAASVVVLLVALLALATSACAGAPRRSPSYAPQSGYTATATAGSASSYREPAARTADIEMLALAEDEGDEGAAPSTAQPVAQPAPPAGNTAARTQPQLEQKLIVEGWLSLEVEEVPEVAEAIRQRVQGAGGRVVNEQLSGAARSWSGHMQVKLPPGQVADFLDWLARQGDIKNKRLQGTDVSRTLFDQEIALDNLSRTLDRLRKLLDREGLVMQDILAIEKEMTRLRGEIERIKGEKRFLEHRVALATVDIDLRRREGVILGASAKIYPGPRLSAMVLFDAGARQRVRMGGGVVIHTVRRLTLELDVFEKTGAESRAALATFGGAFYSDFLGRGRNRFFNPYLGMRVGYGYLGGSAFVFAGGGGVELFKHKYVMIDANARVVGFARENFDVALVASGSVVVAF